MQPDTTSPSVTEAELQRLGAALADSEAQLGAALQRNEADAARQRRYAAIIEASHDAIWSWDMEGVIRSWNAEAERMFGYTSDEILGKSLLTLVPPARMELAREALAKLRSGSWIGDYKTERLHRDGTLIPVELTISPIRDLAGEIVGAATVCRDITERRQFEASLARRMNELSALYRFTDRLHRAQSPADVYEVALDAILAALGCERASILMCDAAGVMRFVAWRGLSEHYRIALGGHSPWQRGERNPQPIFVEDIVRSDEPKSVKAVIRDEGIRSLAFIPLTAQGGVIGKFMAYYAEPHVFAEHESETAVMIARQLDFALERLRVDEARQRVEQDLRESEERFRLMSEHAPVMIWVSDANGGCLHLNRMLRDFWAVDEKDLANFDWRTSMHPDDASEIGRLMMEALATRSSVTIKGRYRRADGRYRLLQTDARPRISARGEFLGMIGVNVDITERTETDAALRDSEERFRLAVEAAPSGMVMTDVDGRILMVNAHAEKLFGYGRDEMIGRPIEMLVPQRFRSAHPGFRSLYRKEASARPMGAGRDLFALRKDGSEIPVEIGLSPIVTPDGLMALAAVVDISGRKNAEAHRELLLAELNHRVKNTLAVVQSIANQTFKGKRASPDAKKAFEGRLIALSCAHDLLTKSNWENASLEELAADTLQAGTAAENRVTLSGPRVLLSPRQALGLGMALHELFTNAVKYGALSNDVGRVELSWTRSQGVAPRLTLVWREREGPPVTPPKSRGFGSLLLERALAQDLDGEVATEFKPVGLVCTIVAPLTGA
jgi:PAS domain S-box-containing protein